MVVDIVVQGVEGELSKVTSYTSRVASLLGGHDVVWSGFGGVVMSPGGWEVEGRSDVRGNESKVVVGFVCDPCQTQLLPPPIHLPPPHTTISYLYVHSLASLVFGEWQGSGREVVGECQQIQGGSPLHTGKP